MPFESEVSPPEPPRKNGRPVGSTKLQPTEETINQIKGLARIQCTMREAAAVLGVHPETFSAFLDAHENARIAWEDGKENGKAALRRLQYKQAENGNATMQIWLGKQWLEQADKAENANTHSGPGGKPIETNNKVEWVIVDPTPLPPKD